MVVGFYLFITIELLKAKIKVLQDNNTLLDEEITRLTIKVNKNRHYIENSLESQKQLPNKKQLLKG